MIEDKETRQYLVFYKTDSEDKLLNRRMYIAGSPREAVVAFMSHMPKATWTEVYELELALSNEFVV